MGIEIDGVMALDERPLRVLDPAESPDPARPILRASSEGRAAGVVDTPRTPVTHSSPPFDADAPLVEAGGELYQLCCQGYLAQFEDELVAFEGATGGPVPTLTAVPATNSTGQKSLLYLRLAFPDSLREPQTEAAASNLMSAANDWFLENSYGRLHLLTTVAPLIVLPRPERLVRTVRIHTARRCFAGRSRDRLRSR